jgi:hypothetical protein
MVYQERFKTNYDVGCPLYDNGLRHRTSSKASSNPSIISPHVGIIASFTHSRALQSLGNERSNRCRLRNETPISKRCPVQ